MKYRVVPTLWPTQGRTFRRGDIVDDAMFGGSAGSFVRLGLLAPARLTGSKKELLDVAKREGVTVPKNATKPQIIALIEGAA